MFFVYSGIQFFYAVLDYFVKNIIPLYIMRSFIRNNRGRFTKKKAPEPRLRNHRGRFTTRKVKGTQPRNTRGRWIKA